MDSTQISEVWWLVLREFFLNGWGLSKHLQAKELSKGVSKHILDVDGLGLDFEDAAAYCSDQLRNSMWMIK